MDDDTDLTTIEKIESSGDSKRDKVREILFKALRPRRMEEEREPALVATIIEKKCFAALKEKDYYAHIRSLKFNISDPRNPMFRSKVLLGYFLDDDFPTLTPEQMASDEKNQERETTRKRTLEECQSDWANRHGGIQESGMFMCGKCKGSRTTYFQMQTRSADEPMTTFVTCLSCMLKEKAIDLIQSCLSPIALVEPFGSYFTDTCTGADDVDLAVLFHTNPAGWVRDGKGKIPLAIVKTVMNRVIKLLPRSSVSINLRIIHSKTPIIKMTVFRTVKVDLVLHDAHGVLMSRVLLDLFNSSPPLLLQLVCSVKQWAKNRKLIDASQGNMSSYGFTLSVIYFLQSLGIVGNVFFSNDVDFFEPVFDSEIIFDIVKTRKTCWYIEPPPKGVTRNIQSYLREFLEYLAYQLSDKDNERKTYQLANISGQIESICCCCIEKTEPRIIVEHRMLIVIEPISKANVASSLSKKGFLNLQSLV